MAATPSPPSTANASPNTSKGAADLTLASNDTTSTSATSGMSSSLSGLPPKDNVEESQDASTSPSTAGAKGQTQGDQSKDFLDLATAKPNPKSTPASHPDLSSKLEQKRLEHERQRDLQKKAFEEQMRKLEVEQEREEREMSLLANNGGSSPAKVSSPSNGVNGSAAPSAPYGAAARSMPTSRRHSGEQSSSPAGGSAVGSGRIIKGGDPNAVVIPAQVHRQSGQRMAPGPQGQGLPHNFLFDDELDADLQSSAWGGKYLQMNTDADKFPVLIRRDSYPGLLSASSAALDLAPLSQTPSHSQRSFGPSRPGASEWPQFQGPRPGEQSMTNGNGHVAPGGPNGSTAKEQPRHRSVTHGGNPLGGDQPSSSVTPSPGGRVSPRPSAGKVLPPPSGVRGSGLSASQSGRNSPALEKKEGGKKIYGVGPGDYVDTLTDQFSNFNIDSNAFGGHDPTQGAFGGYGGNDHGAFVYDGSAGPYGSMGANRFAGLRLEDLQGDMLPLCKDQFGCRYLQKKLEDGNPEHRDMIFNEIFPHFAELMTDPFANYLSQRLLEYSTDEQRDALIESISGELVSISLNMHGTRAVQKMIDYLSTQRQVQSLILALNLNVVTLIKDLNGNHVIQKCLNHLPPEDNQFIYNAVATHCIEVATHRHGCCVLQRCIDHASESQRIQLVTEITYNSLTLVQDAFGNYVVQYVLDLNDNRFIEAIVRQFLGNVSALSAQKFSSNVVEKCIRVADSTGRRAIIDELLNKQRLERLLRDSFANYVVQTALDYAEPSQRAQLIDNIRPILPMIRNTPYGKRIQSKIQRETSDQMGRSGGGYGHHPALHSGGHFYNLGGLHGGPPPPQYMGHHHGGPPMNHMGGPGMGGDFGPDSRGSPYLGGYGGGPQGGPPPQLHNQHPQHPQHRHQQQQHHGGPPSQPPHAMQGHHHQGHGGHLGQNGSIGGGGSFAPFPGGMGGGMQQDFGAGGQGTPSPGLGSHGMSNGGVGNGVGGGYGGAFM